MICLGWKFMKEENFTTSLMIIKEIFVQLKKYLHGKLLSHSYT